MDDARREACSCERSGAWRPEHEARQELGRARATHYPASVMLFEALYGFFQEHQYCGELDGGVEGDRVWVMCTCGAVINRRADDD